MGIDSASVELRVLNKSAFDLPDRSDADADGLEGAIGIQKDRSILGDLNEAAGAADAARGLSQEGKH